MPARAVDAITLRAGEPDSVVVGERRAGHRGRLGAGRDERPGQRRPQPLGVGHQRPQGQRGVRSEAAEQLDGRVGDARRHRRAVDAQDGAGQPGGRPEPRRRRRVAAAALDPEHHAGGALLGHADRADGRLDAGERLARDRAALVDHEPRLDPAAGELGDRLAGRRTEDLLVGAEAEPDVLGRGEAVGRAGARRPRRSRRGSPCRRGCRAPRPRRRGSRRRTAGAATARTRRRVRRRGGPSAPPAARCSRPPSGTAGRACRRGSARGRRTGGGTAARARQGTRRSRGVDLRRVAVGDRRDADQRLQLGDGRVGHGRQAPTPVEPGTPIRQRSCGCSQRRDP